MSIVSPQQRVADQSAANNLTSSGPILGPIVDELSMRPFGRPLGVPEAKAFPLIPFLGGATDPSFLFVD